MVKPLATPVLAALLIVSAAKLAGSQTTSPPSGSVPPNFTVQVWGDMVADFAGRVNQYFELRRKLEAELPPLVLTDSSNEILSSEFNLARLVRRARPKAKRGDIFTPAIATAFKAALLPAMEGMTLEVILDENPGAFSHHVDSRYPTSKPKATIPTAVLSLLPPLPPDLQYGFLGHQLILHDTRTNTIVDMMTCAIPCGVKLKLDDD